MPEISRFLGIVIGMFYSEHGAPHFHAAYGGYEISVEIESQTVHGEYPRQALRLVLEWASLHKVRIADQLGAGAPGRTVDPDRATGMIGMPYHVVEARHVGGHVVWLRFRDGTSGEIDLGPALRGPVFEPLRNPAVFRQFAIHPEFHTLVWPNGADLAPEFLHDNVHVSA